MLTKKLMLLGGVIAVLGGCGQTTSTDSNTTTANIAMGNTSAAASATPAVNRVRGVITAIGTDALTVQTYDGKSATVPLDANTKFAWVVKSDLSTLKDGDFIGTATTGPDDALRAVELVIFPEAMRGTGEGHYPWDVPGAVAAAGGGTNGSSAMTNGTVDGQSAMTNGTVDGQSAMTNGTVDGQSAMTNGTVAQQSGMTNGTVTGGAGKPGETKLNISYKGGKAQVVVPVGTPIVRFEPAERTVLAKGQKLFAIVSTDASGAKSVAVGKDGLTPPM
ncbi:hypothetical protein C8J44_2034 [Sphingomonas sp. PP-CE-3A-406]|uniref:hypothetical protein n=1 Tax=Sphingomonas sp. PP-CE-3A-406 TaxID=2135659 RepID=UPI000F150137|nr:hypothetical protein [Sphingomonas sp. PP-CE-3A-406]RMB54415.1 hypothetical protein C8J44_2034 [Sphingomonas sp. PP-CE-3A-406]